MIHTVVLQEDMFVDQIQPTVHSIHPIPPCQKRKTVLNIPTDEKSL